MFGLSLMRALPCMCGIFMHARPAVYVRPFTHARSVMHVRRFICARPVMRVRHFVHGRIVLHVQIFTPCAPCHTRVLTMHLHQGCMQPITRHACMRLTHAPHACMHLTHAPPICTHLMHSHHACMHVRFTPAACCAMHGMHTACTGHTQPPTPMGAARLLKRLRTPQSRARLAADAAKPRRRRHGGRLARDWLMLALQAGRKLRTLHTPAAAPLAAHSIAGYPLAPLSSGRDRRCRRGSSRYSLLQSTLPELRQPGAAWDAPRLRGSSARGRGRSSPPLELRLEPPLPNGLSLSVPPGQPSACRARRSAPSAKLRVLIRRSVYARETSPGWLAFGARRNAGSMRCISSCAVRRHAHPRLVWASITSFRCCTCRNLSGTYR